MKKTIITGFLTVLLFVAIVSLARATAVEKITWCHVEPNGNQQTLELPQAALENAGHVDANGNPLHAGDHAGACVEPTPTLTPTPTPGGCEEDCDVSPTPTPTVEPSVTPTETPSNPGGPGDGRNDGLGCGQHDCSSHNSPYDGQPVGWK